MFGMQIFVVGIKCRSDIFTRRSTLGAASFCIFVYSAKITSKQAYFVCKTCFSMKFAIEILRNAYLNTKLGKKEEIEIAIYIYIAIMNRPHQPVCN